MTTKINAQIKRPHHFDISDIDEFYQKVKTGHGCLWRLRTETVPALVDKLYSLGIKNYWEF